MYQHAIIYWAMQTNANAEKGYKQVETSHLKKHQTYVIRENEEWNEQLTDDQEQIDSLQKRNQRIYK